jgi:hypothetical protein
MKGMEIEPSSNFITYQGSIVGNFKSKDNLLIFTYDEDITDFKRFFQDLTKLSDFILRNNNSLRYVQVVFSYGLVNRIKEYHEKQKTYMPNISYLIQLGWIPSEKAIATDDQKNFLIDILALNRTLKPALAEKKTSYLDLERKYKLKVYGIFKYRWWIRFSPYAIKIMNEQNPDSFISNVLDIAYPISKRPPTSMSAVARSLKFINTIKLDQPNPSGRPVKVSFKDRLETVLPVTRYSIGIGHGTYYPEEEKEKKEKGFCGTFYYWEPESHIYLLLGNSIYFTNKIIALEYFMARSNDGDLRTAYDMVIADFLDMAESENLFIKMPITINLNYRSELIRLLSSDQRISSPFFKFDNFFEVEGSKKYIGNIFYALEDDLDQLLCATARKHKYDTIILSRMPGNRRIVTELLDTRDRLDSLHNLAWELS